MSAMLYPDTNVSPVDVPAVAPTCETCGEVLYGDRCLNVGACETADASATRGAVRTSAKFSPAAWTYGGRVD